MARIPLLFDLAFKSQWPCGFFLVPYGNERASVLLLCKVDMGAWVMR
jgi:hypothetical protein